MALDGPRLRRDLISSVLHEGGIRCVDVYDPRRGSTFRLFDYEYSVALALDGRPLAKVIPWVRLSTGLELSEEQLTGFAKRLDQLGFLDNGELASARQDSTPASVGHVAPAVPPASEPPAAAASQIDEGVKVASSFVAQTPDPSEPAPVAAAEASARQAMPLATPVNTPTGQPATAPLQTPPPPADEAEIVVIEEESAPVLVEGTAPIQGAQVTTVAPVTNTQPWPLPLESPPASALATEPPALRAQESLSVPAEETATSPVEGESLAVAKEPEPVVAAETPPAPATESPPAPATETAPPAVAQECPQVAAEPGPVVVVGESPLAPPDETARSPVFLVSEPVEPVVTRRTLPWPVAPDSSPVPAAETEVPLAAQGSAPIPVEETAPQQVAEASLSADQVPPAAAGASPPVPMPAVAEPVPAPSESPPPPPVAAPIPSTASLESAPVLSPESQPATEAVQGSSLATPEEPVSAEPTEPAPIPVAEPTVSAAPTASPPVPVVEAALVETPPGVSSKANPVPPAHAPSAPLPDSEPSPGSSSPSVVTPPGTPEPPHGARAAEPVTTRPRASPAWARTPTPGPRPTGTPPPIPTSRPFVTPPPLRAARVRGGPWVLYALFGTLAALAVGVLVVPLALKPRPLIPVPVRVLRAKPTGVLRWFDVTASAELVPGQVLKFPAGGKVVRLISPELAFRPGDVVAATDAARLALAELTRQQEQLAFLKQIMEGLRASRDEKVVASAEANVVAKAERVERALAALSRVAVVAKAPGRVEAPFVIVGQNVEAGAPAVRLRSTGWRATFELPRAQVTLVRRQGFCQAEIERRLVACSLASDGGDETHVVVALAPEAVTAAGQMVRLARSRLADAFLVPASALSHVGASDRVFVVAPTGRAEMRSVTVVDRTPTDAIITQGLDPGDAVVLESSQPIGAGAQVRITESLSQ
jgi:hypothetical protein